MTITATYSAEDNKLRLYAEQRLDDETFQRIKAKGFRWAPRQELFVTPKWTPEREDICLELAGEIEREESTLAERAEAKAERLANIASNREKQSNAYFNQAREISARFAGGQPVLAGHHSQRKAERDHEKADRALSKAVKAHNSIHYWSWKIAGVENHAERKNRTGVRLRRIKTLLKGLRDHQRRVNDYHAKLSAWQSVDAEAEAVYLADYRDHYACDMLRDGTPWQDVKAKRVADFENATKSKSAARWINHYLGRLGYERAMLGEVARFDGKLTPVILQGFAREHGAGKPKASKSDFGFVLTSPVPLPVHIGQGQQELELPEDDWRDLMQSCGYTVPAPKPKAPPILNLDVAELSSKHMYFEETETLGVVKMTKAQFRDANSRIASSVCGNYRIRTCVDPFYTGPQYKAGWVAAFLTDSKAHAMPESEDA